MCPERAFPEGAAAQEALSAVMNIEPPLAMCVVYWLHPIAAKSGGVGEILACFPTFFTSVFDLLEHQPGVVGRSLWLGAAGQWRGCVMHSPSLILALSNSDISFCWLGLFASKLRIKDHAYFRNEVICHLDSDCKFWVYLFCFISHSLI